MVSATRLRHAEAMLRAGASLIDVGGESAAPGARAVCPVEAGAGLRQIIEAIAAELDVIISVDTSTPAVMRETARPECQLDQ
jgi:dihydropteroate synthase